MALKNTSDRYDYIFGNTAAKADISSDDYSGRRYKKRKASAYRTAAAPLTDPYQEEKKTPDGNGRRRRRRRAAHAHDFDWKFTLIASLAFFLIIAGAIFYVRGTIILHNMYDQVTELKEEKTTLLGKQAALESEIDKATNLDEIRTYAIKKLKMVYPGKEQVIYYTDNNEDYIRQYESVDAGK